MVKIYGKQARMWIGGVEIEPATEWSVEVKADDEEVAAFRNQYVELSKGVTFSGSAVFDDRALANQLWEGSFLTTVKYYPSGDRWFMPWFELEGYQRTASLWDGSYLFELSGDTYERRWNNRLAPVVYWMWRHLWLPARRVVGKTLRFLGLNRHPSKVE